jgi:hypothetical protein
VTKVAMVVVVLLLVVTAYEIYAGNWLSFR